MGKLDLSNFPIFFCAKIKNMRYATLAEEKKLWKKGFKNVAGLDEAGRGPLAGPVVAGAVIINWRTFLQGRSVLLKIRDSKQLSAKQREFFYNLITKDKNIRWGIGIVSEKIIDKINIKNAAELAMARAIKKLKPDFLIIDGNNIKNYKLKIINYKLIVKGDEKVFSCAAASILAKVTRDRIMLKYHKKFPKYRFDLHKGYGTKLHLEMLKRFGRCAIHRNSFKF
ncbi:MAG: ribonuclease HII [Patescibacteria group bacterium]